MDKVIEFLQMGGYAFFVWGSFGVTAAFMIAEPIFLGHRRNVLLKRLRRMARLGHTASSN